MQTNLKLLKYEFILNKPHDLIQYFKQKELAERCAASEQYVGTQGGGMDQAISICAEGGSAKLIDFNPLKLHNITLPEGSQFVITNSCVEINKAATNQFNTRVVECRLASQVLAKLQGLEWRKVKKPKLEFLIL